MCIESIKRLEFLATNKEVSPPTRAIAAGVLLMSYDSLRFSDVQRIRPFEANSDSIQAPTPFNAKKKKPIGLDWPWACPRMGMTGAADWARPLLDFRAAHAKTNGSDLSFTFPRINRLCELDIDGPAPSRKLGAEWRSLSRPIGDKNGGPYTSHPPRESPIGGIFITFELGRGLNFMVKFLGGVRVGV